jgi:hypothetical protein
VQGTVRNTGMADSMQCNEVYGKQKKKNGMPLLRTYAAASTECACVAKKKI